MFIDTNASCTVSILSIVLVIGSNSCFIYVINTYISPTSIASFNTPPKVAHIIIQILKFSKIVISAGSNPSIIPPGNLEFLKACVKFSHSSCFSL